MAEYIDREKLIPDRCYHEPEGYEAVSIDQIFHEDIADVVERAKILDFIEDNRPTDIQTDWEMGCAYICDEIEKLLM